MYGNTALPSRTAVERVFSAGKNKLKPQTAWQTQRHGGGHIGAVPPQTKIVPPPMRGPCPEEIKRLGATGVQIGVCHCYFRAFCGLTPDFM